MVGKTIKKRWGENTACNQDTAENETSTHTDVIASDATLVNPETYSL